MEILRNFLGNLGSGVVRLLVTVGVLVDPEVVPRRQPAIRPSLEP